MQVLITIMSIVPLSVVTSVSFLPSLASSRLVSNRSVSVCFSFGSLKAWSLYPLVLSLSLSLILSPTFSFDSDAGVFFVFLLGRS
ncbi:hypothetical protein BCV70DRAFT_52413 [Testicularia cyperi]|uniref:Uncharacterized protein n=1 Tax=Testicularia cyperi TaxID=1882483 RepID=A0A317XUB0_9BASI|nr:hypothetical protein BCV70DRAFT_52413 [Testicularia cyperi]